MKFKCDPDSLANVLGTTGKAVGAKQSFLVLSGAHMRLSGDDLTVTSTDREMVIQTTRKVEGVSDGVTLVPARLLNDVVRSFDPGTDSIELELTDSSLRISSDRSNFSLQTMNPDDFPQVEMLTTEPVTLQSKTFLDALGQVVTSASVDDARPVLNGVLLSTEESGLRLVATDSYRLGLRDLPDLQLFGTEGSKQVLVSRRPLEEVVRLYKEETEIQIRLSETEASFAAGDTVIGTRLIVGDFPSYRGLIPDKKSQPNVLTVEKELLHHAVRRVKLLARDSAPIRLKLSDDGLLLSAITQDVGEAKENIDAKYEGEEIELAFNPQYFLDGLESISSDEVTLHITDSLKPAVLRSTETEDYLYLLMPIRIT